MLDRSFSLESTEKTVKESRAEQADDDGTDRELVRAALEGDSDALDTLVRRHQGFIYGIVIRMLWASQDAEDLTQEILLKIVTGLSSFRGESAFQTWAYRIATNHVLNWRRGRAERAVRGFGDFEEKLDSMPDLDLAEDPGAEGRILVEETRVACLTGMLLCLDREQRLTFVLGEVFEVSDAVGSEILGITRQNYRQRLARARRQLYGFMRGKCGLANPANPCRCDRKTREAIRAGIVDPGSLRFVPSHVTRVEHIAKERSRDLERVIGGSYAHLYRDHHHKEPPDFVTRLRAILANRGLRQTLELDGERP